MCSWLPFSSPFPNTMVVLQVQICTFAPVISRLVFSAAKVNDTTFGEAWWEILSDTLPNKTDSTHHPVMFFFFLNWQTVQREPPNTTINTLTIPGICPGSQELSRILGYSWSIKLTINKFLNYCKILSYKAMMWRTVVLFDNHLFICFFFFCFVDGGVPHFRPGAEP